MPEMLDYKFEGNEKSNEVVVFLQGWPDNWEMWEWVDYKTQLKDYKMLFINFPNTGG